MAQGVNITMKLGIPWVLLGLACSTGGNEPADPTGGSVTTPAPERVPIAVVTRDLPVGATLSSGDVGMIQLPLPLVMDAHVREPVEGMQATTELYSGQPLHTERLTIPAGASAMAEPRSLRLPDPQPEPPRRVVARIDLEPGHTIDEKDLFLVELGVPEWLGCGGGRCFDGYQVVGRVVEERILANEVIRAERLRP